MSPHFRVAALSSLAAALCGLRHPDLPPTAAADAAETAAARLRRAVPAPLRGPPRRAPTRRPKPSPVIRMPSSSRASSRSGARTKDLAGIPAERLDPFLLSASVSGVDRRARPLRQPDGAVAGPVPARRQPDPADRAEYRNVATATSRREATVAQAFSDNPAGRRRGGQRAAPRRKSVLVDATSPARRSAQLRDGYRWPSGRPSALTPGWTAPTRRSTRRASATT